MTKMKKNEDLVKKFNLSEAVKRIQKINEYSFYDATMVEDEQDPNDTGDEMPPMDEPQGGDMGGEANPTGDANPPMNGTQDGDIGGDSNAMGDEMPPMPDAQGDDFGDELGDDMDVEDVEMDTEQPGDEVVDVDELTQSQEATEFKVDNVDDKLNKVLDVISKFEDAIAANDQKIEDLKYEFAKRNPTAEETLNLRSLASYPFSERPDEYWKKQQEEHPNYNVISDNDVSTSDEQKEFEIRKSDVDNFNERDILKSLGENHIKLSDFLQF